MYINVVGGDASGDGSPSAVWFCICGVSPSFSGLSVLSRFFRGLRCVSVVFSVATGDLQELVHMMARLLL